MEGTEILSVLQSVFNDVFDEQGSGITERTTAANIEDWDSLTNIELMIAVEEKFDIKFTAADLNDLQSVGDLVRLIQTKKAA